MAISYLHPYVETNIYDNSETYDTGTGSSTVLFQPYFSERGSSDKLEMFSDLSEFLKEKGYPNIRKYGQASYNIVNWLKNGGKVLGIRLTSDKSSYANFGLNVKTKVDTVKKPVVDAKGATVYEADGTTPKTTTEKKVLIKLESITIPDLTTADDDSVQAILNSYDSHDKDGYKDNVIMLMRAKGRGVYGNNMAVRLASSSVYDNTYDYKIYNLTVVQTNNNGTIRTSEGPTGVSFYPDAVTLGGSSYLISQIVKDYFNEISCYFNEKGYDRLIDIIMEGTNNAYDTTGAIDFIYGDDHITVDQSGASQLFTYTGLFFENGSDGDLYVPRTLNQSEMDNLLVNAYTGVITKEIYDKKQYPIDVVLDANYSVAVKAAINDFTNQRGDCICLLDTGEQSSPSSTINWKKSNLVIDDYLSSIWSQMFTVYDSYTARDIYVTPTYFLASKIPYCDNNYGIQYPFVGPNRGVITGFKSLNWAPTEDQKESLYNEKVNYIEQNYKNTKFMSQLTAQSKNTSLSDINHVRVMLNIIRSVEELVSNFLFELGTPETIAKINNALNSLLSQWVNNGTCTTCSGTCSQTALEAESKIAHVTVNLVFVDVIERIVVDINVSK